MRIHNRLIVAIALGSLLIAGQVMAKETLNERDLKEDTERVTARATGTTQGSISETAPTLPGTPSPTPSAAPETGEQINWWVISAGGGSGASASYQLAGTIGQTAVETGTSASYTLISGFMQDFGGSSTCCIGTVGNVNGDLLEEVTIGDIAVLVNHLFIEKPLVDCVFEADINQSGGTDPSQINPGSDITIGDVAILTDYLFITTPALYGPLLTCF